MYYRVVQNDQVSNTVSAEEICSLYSKSKISDSAIVESKFGEKVPIAQFVEGRGISKRLLQELAAPDLKWKPDRRSKKPAGKRRPKRKAKKKSKGPKLVCPGCGFSYGLKEKGRKSDSRSPYFCSHCKEVIPWRFFHDPILRQTAEAANAEPSPAPPRKSSGSLTRWFAGTQFTCAKCRIENFGQSGLFFPPYSWCRQCGGVPVGYHFVRIFLLLALLSGTVIGGGLAVLAITDP